MWVCPSCGFEVDDYYDTCMFCGNAKVFDSVDSENAPNMPEPTNTNLLAPSKTTETANTTVGYQTKKEADQERQPQTSIFTQESSNEVKEPSETVLVLVEGRSGESICIDALSCILGREGDYRPELFSDRVSREQVEINRIDSEGWTIRHIGSTNPSVLLTKNGKLEMVYGVEYPLHGGERIRLANQTFLVRVEQPNNILSNDIDKDGTEEDALNEISSEAFSTAGVVDSVTSVQEQGLLGTESDYVEGWFVVCSKCGSTFQVADETSRVGECPKCIDIMDKRDIKRIAPVYGKKPTKAVVDVR